MVSVAFPVPSPTVSLPRISRLSPFPLPTVTVPCLINIVSVALYADTFIGSCVVQEPLVPLNVALYKELVALRFPEIVSNPVEVKVMVEEAELKVPWFE